MSQPLDRQRFEIALELLHRRRQLAQGLAVHVSAVAREGRDGGEEPAFRRRDGRSPPRRAQFRLLADEHRLLAELDQAPRRKVDHRRRDRLIGRPVVHDQRGHGRGQAVRRGRHQDGVVVDVDRVAPVGVPAHQDEDDQPDRERQDADPDGGVDDAGPSSWAACSGVAAASTSERAIARAPSKSPSTSFGFMSLSIDGLAVGIGQEGGPEAAAGIQRNLAVLRLSCMSNRITRPSSKPARPTPHWFMSARASALALSRSSLSGLTWV